MRLLPLITAMAATILASPAASETTLCKEITSIPFTITEQGNWCLKKDLTTAIASGPAITIATNSVIIDFNGFKLGGGGAGVNTQAIGIVAVNRISNTVRNGTIRGFRTGISFTNLGTDFAAHVIEDMRIDTSREAAIFLRGGVGSIIRENHITNTGSLSATASFGILIDDAISTQIAGNVVNATLADTNANGIYVSQSTRTEVVRNTVSTVVSDEANGAKGIFSFEASEVVIDDNTLINNGTGRSIELVDTSNAACVDNKTVNFNLPRIGCNLDSGNVNL